MTKAGGYRSHPSWTEVRIIVHCILSPLHSLRLNWILATPRLIALAQHSELCTEIFRGYSWLRSQGHAHGAYSVVFNMTNSDPYNVSASRNSSHSPRQLWSALATGIHATLGFLLFPPAFVVIAWTGKEPFYGPYGPAGPFGSTSFRVLIVGAGIGLVATLAYLLVTCVATARGRLHPWSLLLLLPAGLAGVMYFGGIHAYVSDRIAWAEIEQRNPSPVQGNAQLLRWE